METGAEEAARQTTRQIVLSMAPEPPLGDHADLDLADDLAYHSLALLEMAFALEDEFLLPPIDQESAQEIRTVGDVENYIISQLRAGRQAGQARVAE
jgi:acyl carrier protein